MSEPISLPTTTSPRGFKPTAPSRRIQVIDALRGLAIFGILMVNMHYFAHPWQAPHLTATSTVWDEAVSWIVNAFFTTKFFNLFSFLFGLGMAIQMRRAEEKGIRFVPFYVRRLLVLMLLGLAHGILIWYGDILFIYSLLGFLTLFIWRKCRPVILVRWAFILLGLLILFYTLSAGSMLLAQRTPEGRAMLAEIVSEGETEMEAGLAHDTLLYGTGSYGQIVQERVSDFAEIMVTSNLWIAPNILAMFLLGLAFGKKRMFQNLDENRALWRRLLFILLPIGLATNIGWASLGYDLTSSAAAMTPRFMGALILLNIGGASLSLSYISGLALLSRHPPAEKLFAPFAAVGRLALTNYLLHSLVMTTIFYGYGFGLLGQVGVAGAVLMGILLYALQVPFSLWWMKRFRFGPFEWMWRSLTYGAAQPLRAQ